MVVDTLKTVRRLKEAGFSEEQAEILTEIIFDGAPHGPSMPPAAINGEDHAPGPNFGVQPSGAAAHPPPVRLPGL